MSYDALMILPWYYMVYMEVVEGPNQAQTYKNCPFNDTSLWGS